jgi:GTP cyclohydrolase II
MLGNALRFVWEWFHEQLRGMSQWKVMRITVRRNHLQGKTHVTVSYQESVSGSTERFDESLFYRLAAAIIKKFGIKSFYFTSDTHQNRRIAERQMHPWLSGVRQFR